MSPVLSSVGTRALPSLLVLPGIKLSTMAIWCTIADKRAAVITILN